MRRLLAVLVLLTCASPAVAFAQDGSPATPPAVLLPGDRVNITVLRNAELTGTYTVATDSTLQHPLYAEVKVAGIPIPDAQARVRTFLQRFGADPRFTFIPEYRVFVGGVVRDQNQYFLPDATIAQAITRAGGSTAPNRKLRMRLIRNGRHTVVAMNDAKAAPLLQEPIRSGDQILIEDRPTFARTYLNPALQVLQTVTALISTYVFLDAVLGSDDDSGGSGSGS